MHELLRPHDSYVLELPRRCEFGRHWLHDIEVKRLAQIDVWVFGGDGERSWRVDELEFKVIVVYHLSLEL